MLEPEERPQRRNNQALDRLVTELRALRASADHGETLSFRKLEARVPSSLSALNKAVNGRSVPSWEIVKDFVTGCGADPATYRDLWVEARAAVDAPGPTQGDRVPDPAPLDASHGHAKIPEVPVDSDPRGGEPSREAGRSAWTGRVVALTVSMFAVVLLAIVGISFHGWDGNAAIGSSFLGNNQNHAPPITATMPTGADFYASVSRPSQHCTYYHHFVGGTNVGSRYDCSSNASLTTYHVWIVCSNSPAKLVGPSVPRGTPSSRDCPAGSLPAVGGFDRDS